MTFRTKAFFRQWHQRILALLLFTILMLIGSLTYKIYQQNQDTEAKDLTIQASNFVSMKEQEYEILATMIQQDYATFREFQDHIGEVDDLTTLALASNQSYQSRFLESLTNLRNTIPFGHNLGAIYLFQEDEDYKVNWYWEREEDTEATDVLVEQVYKKLPGKAYSPYFQFLKVLDHEYLLYIIPLQDKEVVVGVFNAFKEFAKAPFFLEVTDKGNNKHIKGLGNPDRFEYNDKLQGLELRFATNGRRDGFLPTILSMAILVLVLLLYQFHIAREESHTHELTGLPNMRNFDGFLKQALKRPGTTFLLFLDLRSLKLLNTIFLEEQADEIIKHFANTLRNTLDHNDHVIHRSGDEIFILMTIDDNQLLEPIFKRLRSQFRKSTVRLQVRQCRDAKGKHLKLYGKELRTNSFIDHQISFRIGGFAIDDAKNYRSQKAMLDRANLLAEEAKKLEDETQADVIWRVSYTENNKEYLLESKPEESLGPRLIARN